MKRLAHPLLAQVLAGVVFLGLAAIFTPAAHPQSRFDRPSLDSMLAPIALYPDQLLSHVLMAATYPNEVEEAARWLRARPGLSGDAAVRISEDWDWDPSVRSLLAFPLVLDTMATHLAWTEDLGNAFLYQRGEVMEVVQFLRRRAYEAGTLRSTESVRVVDNGYAIVIESVVAQSVYVPYYDPYVAYGAWWWPVHPPMHWSRWPGYHDRHGYSHYLLWGPGIRVSGGFFFGNFAWARREVRVVDVRPFYYHYGRRPVVGHPVAPGHGAPMIAHPMPGPGLWQHDPRHRPNEATRSAPRTREPQPRTLVRPHDRQSAPSPPRAEEPSSRAPRSPPSASEPVKPRGASSAPVPRDSPTSDRPSREQGNGARSPGRGSRRDEPGSRQRRERDDRSQGFRLEPTPRVMSRVPTPEGRHPAVRAERDSGRATSRYRHRDARD